MSSFLITQPKLTRKADKCSPSESTAFTSATNIEKRDQKNYYSGF